MADLEPHVPKAIEDRLGDGFAPGRLFVGKQEQEIDVGAGRQHAGAVAAGGDDRHALGLGRVLRRVEVLDRELEHQADDLVLHGAEPLGATASVAVGDEQPLGRGAPVRERGPQPPRHRQSEFVLAAGVDGRQLFELGRDGNRIENFGFGRNLIAQGQHGSIGIAERRRCVIPKSIPGRPRESGDP